MHYTKNEHIIYAYGELGDKPGSHVLLIGVTDHGVQTLKKQLTLTIDFPSPIAIRNVIVFQEKDKATLKQRLRDTGLDVHEIN